MYNRDSEVDSSISTEYALAIALNIGAIVTADVPCKRNVYILHKQLNTYLDLANKNAVDAIFKEKNLRVILIAFEIKSRHLSA